MKTDLENYIFWFETGSGFGERGGTHLQKTPRRWYGYTFFKGEKSENSKFYISSSLC